MNWKIIESISIKQKTRFRNAYVIQCSCGYKRKIYTSEWNNMIKKEGSFRCGTSCRMCTHKNKKENKSNDDLYLSLYKNQISFCKRNKKAFEIDFNLFLKLSKSNCYYCNQSPSNIFKKNIKYNGIDRIDSEKGYIKNNVRSCCFNCNRAKSNLTEKDFLKLISNIYTNCVQRLSEASE